MWNKVEGKRSRETLSQLLFECLQLILWKEALFVEFSMYSTNIIYTVKPLQKPVCICTIFSFTLSLSPYTPLYYVLYVYIRRDFSLLSFLGGATWFRSVWCGAHRPCLTVHGERTFRGSKVIPPVQSKLSDLREYRGSSSKTRSLRFRPGV